MFYSTCVTVRETRRRSSSWATHGSRTTDRPSFTTCTASREPRTTYRVRASSDSATPRGRGRTRVHASLAPFIRTRVTRTVHSYARSLAPFIRTRVTRNVHSYARHSATSEGGGLCTGTLCECGGERPITVSFVRSLVRLKRRAFNTEA